MNVLAIGAHPDDVELGCGASLAIHADAGHGVFLLVMTAGERGPHAGTRNREQERAAEILGAGLIWGGQPDGHIDGGAETVRIVERTLDLVQPDVVYAHALDDSHQDHRAVATATVAACRRHTRVCHFETPSALGFQPKIFVDATAGLERKLEALRAHSSQVIANRFVDLDAVVATARFRGFQARVPNAEAFDTTRFVWEPTNVRDDRSQAYSMPFGVEFGMKEEMIL